MSEHLKQQPAAAMQYTAQVDEMVSMQGHRRMVGPTAKFWKDKRVFITGHTGFKGVWLSLWLQSLGATVYGYSTSSRAAAPIVSMTSFRGDICDLQALQAAMQTAAPQFVIHMAAQPLVRRAVNDPIGTYRTNVIGTATLLESVRRCGSVRAAIIVTTDRCYENQNWEWPYREADPLAGNDPYSSSKACMELVVGSYRQSFFSAENIVGVATARAGNMVGGGDWADDRLVPDTVQSFAAGKAVTLRNPKAARPWQYVLETLRGYLLLAEKLYVDPLQYSGAWNFGPNAGDIRSVGWIVEKLAEAWGAEAKWRVQPGNLPQETQMMRLDCSKATAELGWQPVVELADALESTVAWYRDFYAGKPIREKYLEQLADYIALVNAEQAEFPETSPAR